MEKLSDHLYIEPMGKVIERERKAAAEKARQRQRQVRHFAAGRISRGNADWTTSPYGANWLLRANLHTLRARSREMAKNAPHFRRFMLMARSNVIGSEGIRLQCQTKLGRGGGLNSKLNKQIEREFYLWGYRETCTASGKLDWTGTQNLFLEHWLRDGEVLCQHIEADNEYGYSLKFWNVDWLDETHNEILKGGNRVIMGVEVDADDRPVAYWLTTPSSEINFTAKRERQRTRIPAEQMIHAFLVSEDESQTRGVPYAACVIVAGKHFQEYTNNVVEQSRVAAATFGFLKKETPDEVEFTGQETDEGHETIPTIDVAPLSMNELPAGYDYVQHDPKQPTQQHAEFSNTMLLHLAAGLGIFGASLSGDLSAVNYSSAQFGRQEEIQIWKAMQSFVANVYCRVVFHRWLKAAWLAGKVSLTPQQFADAQNPLWRPRGWRSIDPVKEVTANVEALRCGLTTWTSVLAEQGIDLETHLDTLVAEQKLAAAKGVELKIPDKSAAPAAEPGKPDEDDDEPPAKEKKKASASLAANGNGNGFMH